MAARMLASCRMLASGSNSVATLRKGAGFHRSTRHTLARRLLATTPARIPNLQVSRAIGWQQLPPNERAAWAALGWTEVSWAGKRHAPLSGLQHWDDLTPAERGAAAFGLGYTEEMWNAEKDASAIVAIPEDTAPAAPAVNGGGAVGSLARAVWGVAKAAAPIAGSALSRSRHPGMMVAGHVLQSMPSVVDAMADPVVVDAIETIVYLDDSGSMRSDSGSREFFGGSLLDEGKKVRRQAVCVLSDSQRLHSQHGSMEPVLSPFTADHLPALSFMTRLACPLPCTGARLDGSAALRTDARPQVRAHAHRLSAKGGAASHHRPHLLWLGRHERRDLHVAHDRAGRAPSTTTFHTGLP